jgi:large subunit ribosomal protein LP2
MRHLAAYLLLVAGGNSNPTADDIKDALSKVGIETDEERLNQLLSELERKDLNELIKEGSEKLCKVAVGSGGGGVGAPAAAAGSAPAAAAAPEKPKVEEVDALDGGMDMFGGGGGGGGGDY